MRLDIITAQARWLGVIVSLLSVVVVASGCSSGGGSSPSPDDTPAGAALDVVTTIYPVTYFAERVGGDRVAIDALITPGVDAHDFEPTPGDVIAIGNADVLIYTDPAFEQWVEDALDSVGSNDLFVVRTADLMAEQANAHDEEVGHDHEGLDPHVWLNPLEAIEQVRAIETAFASADPDGNSEYSANADALVSELEALDNEFSTALAGCSQDHIVVSHEAYGHLADRYGFEQTGLADLSGESETTPRRVAQIIDEIRELGITHILQEPIVDDQLAETVAAETGTSILELHPLESLTRDEVDAGDDYFSVMRRNLASLQIALECS